MEAFLRLCTQGVPILFLTLFSSYSERRYLVDISLILNCNVSAKNYSYSKRLCQDLYTRAPLLCDRIFVDLSNFCAEFLNHLSQERLAYLIVHNTFAYFLYFL